MPTERLVPLLWPAEGLDWRLLESTPINCILSSDAAVAGEARRRQLTICPIEQVPATVVRDAVWPRIPVSAKGAKDPKSVGAGPTGAPWVESNGWRVTLALAKNPAKPVWVMAAPPKDAAVRAEAYSVAISDAAATGGQWIIAPDAELIKGLRAKDEAALSTWRSIVSATRFFEEHAGWGRQPVTARLGIVSEFAGPNLMLSKEVLNLAARRHLQYRAIDRAAFTPESLTGLRSLLWIDAKAPEASVREFAKQGGLLILPASAAHLTDGLEAEGQKEAYALFKAGSGRVARSMKPWTDPYLLITEVHRLMSREQDVLRLWNAGSTNVRYSESGVVQVVNYAGREVGHPMSLWVAKPYRKASWSNLTGVNKQALPVTAKANGTEVALPVFTSYAAVEFGE